jgi:hypothetical protein
MSTGTAMRRILGIVLVIVLTGMGAAGGYFGTAAFVGARASFEAMNHVCHTLQIAETRQIINPQQRSAIVEQMLSGAARAAGDENADASVLTGYLKGDCAQSVWQFITKA